MVSGCPSVSTCIRAIVLLGMLASVWIEFHQTLVDDVLH